MGLFNRKEKRATNEDILIRSLTTEETITRENALSIPSVLSCVEFISNTIAMLPIKLYRECTHGDKKTDEVADDPRVRLLNDDTGDTLDAFQAKKAFVRDILLDGNGYMYINKKRNDVQSLHYVEANNVSVMNGIDPIFKSYDIMVYGKKYDSFEFIIVTRNSVNGGSGIGIVEESSKILSLAYNLLLYETYLVKNGGNKKGFLKSEKKLTKEVIEAIRAAWRDLYANNQSNMIILNDGIDFKESANTSVEMQLNENKKTNSEAICQLFNLSPKITSGQATQDEFVSTFKTAISPLLLSIQTALNKCLLLEDEKNSMYFAFDDTEQLKGDVLRRYQAYSIGLKANFLQIDEVRYKEDLAPLGFNYITLGLQDVLLNPKTNEVYTPNTNKLMDLKGVNKDES